MIDKLPPMHPGEVLREEFMIPLGLSAGDLAERCGASSALIEQIANEEVGITADMAAVPGVRRLDRVLAQPPSKLRRADGARMTGGGRNAS
jgi:addiction module HigA family antidote